VTKYDFLLRNVKFTIETGPKSLTYLKTAQAAKYGVGSTSYRSMISAVYIQLEPTMSWPMPSHGYVSPISRTMLTSVQFILEGSADSATEERPPVTTGHSSPPLIRAQIEKVHNSVKGHFGVEYARKALLSRGALTREGDS
jgi:hypothetical protein